MDLWESTATCLSQNGLFSCITSSKNDGIFCFGIQPLSAIPAKRSTIFHDVQLLSIGQCLVSPPMHCPNHHDTHLLVFPRDRTIQRLKMVVWYQSIQRYIYVSFYNSTASTWTLATPRTTWQYEGCKHNQYVCFHPFIYKLTWALVPACYHGVL